VTVEKSEADAMLFVEVRVTRSSRQGKSGRTFTKKSRERGNILFDRGQILG
jgi:hypothetical protein